MLNEISEHDPFSLMYEYCTLKQPHLTMSKEFVDFSSKCDSYYFVSSQEIKVEDYIKVDSKSEDVKKTKARTWQDRRLMVSRNLIWKDIPVLDRLKQDDQMLDFIQGLVRYLIKYNDPCDVLIQILDLLGLTPEDVADETNWLSIKVHSNSLDQSTSKKLG
jgi:hypothetical protein